MICLYWTAMLHRIIYLPLFDITQDNTGLVTITPNGEGASWYEVYYGDATPAPAKVLPGKNTQHTYAEGVYNVKIVGHTLPVKQRKLPNN